MSWPRGYVETDSGKVLRELKSTYKRHGTLNLFAALEVGTGEVRTKFTVFKKREDFRGFLDGVMSDQRQDAEIHHFTPTSASSLNQIEIVFSRCNARHSTEEASKPKMNCARPLKPSSEGIMSAPNRFAGGNARSRAVNSKIHL